MGLREVGRNCVKFLKRGSNRIEGMGHKHFSKGGELGQGMDFSNRGGLEPPYELCIIPWNISQMIMKTVPISMEIT